MNKCVKYQELVVQITYVDEMLIAGPADIIATEQRNAKGTVTKRYKNDGRKLSTLQSYKHEIILSILKVLKVCPFLAEIFTWKRRGELGHGSH